MFSPNKKLDNVRNGINFCIYGQVEGGKSTIYCNTTFFLQCTWIGLQIKIVLNPIGLKDHRLMDRHRDVHVLVLGEIYDLNLLSVRLSPLGAVV